MDNGYSPLLSLATGGVEIILAIWVLYSPGRKRVRQLVAALFIVLAGYQFAEVFVCSRPTDLLAARIAFCIVLWLPAIALSLMLEFTGTASKTLKNAVRFCWLFSVFICVWILVDQSFVIGTVCSTVIATFYHDTLFEHVFGIYYELGLGGIIVGGALAMVRIEDKIARAHIADLQIGVVGFMIPAFLAQVVIADIDPSLPSLMCHFAIVLAFFLWRLMMRERRAFPSG